MGTARTRQNSVCRVGSAAEGCLLGPMEKPRLPLCVCERVPAHVFSGMAVRQTAAQYGFDFVAASSAGSDIVVCKHTLLGMNTRTQTETHRDE